jgi:hypothetical protein
MELNRLLRRKEIWSRTVWKRIQGERVDGVGFLRDQFEHLARLMGKVMCESGHTKFGKALTHVRREHRQQPISAVICIGDAMEECHSELCDLAAGLGVPCFIFQEGNDPDASRTFAEMARLSKGAHCRFDAGAARQLAELLRAVAAFATGGVKALENQHTDSARKLLGQIKGGRS